MDQKKIGRFLKKLRNEKGLTQEQFAEYFDVHIEEILDGERKTPAPELEIKNTLLKVADYSTNENIIFSKQLNYTLSCGA